MIELKQETKTTTSINVDGRIDGENADKVYKLISNIRNEHQAGKLVLYCAGLDYLSSAGLRVLLKLQKSEKKKITLRQVKEEVKKVLTMAGFHKIMNIDNLEQIKLPNGQEVERIGSECVETLINLPDDKLADIDKQLREIEVDEAKLIGTGTTGNIYRLDDEDMVKIYNEGTSLRTVCKEVVMSKRAFIMGIPTAISYDVVKVNNNYGAIFEIIDGDTLANVLKKEPDKYEYYAAKYANLFYTIHHSYVDDNFLLKAKDIFLKAIDKCVVYYTDEEIDLLKKVVMAIPDRNSFVHRDYHPKNIMVSNGKLILIDMPDVCIGHPIFDWMGIIVTHEFFAEKFPKETEANAGVTTEGFKRLLSSLLNMYFVDKSYEEIETIYKQIERYARILLAISPILRPEQHPAINEVCIDEAKENLFPYIEEMIGDIDW